MSELTEQSKTKAASNKKIIAIKISLQKRERHICQSDTNCHPRPTYTDPPMGGGGWNIGELIITNATVCPPHLSTGWTNRRELILQIDSRWKKDEEGSKKVKCRTEERF